VTDPIPRRATPADIVVLLTLVEEFCAADRHDFDAARVTRALVPLLADDAVGQVWLLESAGQAHGYAIVTWTWSLESGGRDCILDEIYVRQPGHGHGSRLLEHALAEAEARGALAVFLESESHNDRARSFYARHGFGVEDSVWMSQPLPRDRAAGITPPAR